LVAEVLPEISGTIKTMRLQGVQLRRKEYRDFLEK